MVAIQLFYHVTTCSLSYTLNPTTLMDDEFDALVHEAFYTFIEFRPDVATFFGLHQYDTKMPSGTKESKLKFIDYLSEYLEK